MTTTTKINDALTVVTSYIGREVVKRHVNVTAEGNRFHVSAVGSNRIREFTTLEAALSTARQIAVR